MSRLPSLQRLIAVFLLVGTVAGTGVWWLNLPSAAPVSETGNVARPASVPGNAFSESLPDTPATREFMNLTSLLAQKTGDELMRANPNGPIAIEDILAADLPDIETISNDFVVATVAQGGVAALRPEVVPPYTSKDLKLQKGSSANIAAYRDGMQELMAGTLASDSVDRILAMPATPTTINSIRLLLEETVAKLENSPVPESLTGLHLALLRMVALERNMTQTASYLSDDPLRAGLVFDLQSRNLLVLINDFQREFRLAAGRLSAAQPGWSIIPRAHAQWITWDPAKFGVALREFLWTAFVDAIKDRLVHRLVQQTITWIQGGGKPQFLTNWKGFLKDAGNAAAGDLISKINPRLCQNFGPILRISLLEVNLAEKPVTCTLDQVVQNIKDFANDFTQGGWVAYGATLQPQNNFWGSIIEAGDIVSKMKETEKEAAKKKAESGAGYLGQQDCAKYDWEESPGTGGTLPSRRLVCKEYKVTTPPSTVAEVINQHIPAPLERIVNAEDIAALVSALVNSALNKLIQIGERGLLGLRPTSGQEGPLPDPCAGLTGTEWDRCRNEACRNYPPEEVEQCEQSIEPPPPSVCEFGEVPVDSGNACLPDDQSGTPGIACDNDAFEVEMATNVRLICASGAGTAFIAKTTQNCNVRDDQGTLGWTFAGDGAYDLDGNPVEFAATLQCPGEPISVILEPGRYSAGAWTETPCSGATVCGVDIRPLIPPAPPPTNVPVITEIGDPVWPGLMAMVKGRDLRGDLIFSGAGASSTVIRNIEVHQGGTVVFFRIPQVPPGNYGVVIGPEGNRSAPFYITVRAQRFDDVAVVDATPGWNGSIANNPNDNTWLVVSNAIPAGRSDYEVFGRILDNNTTYITPSFNISAPNTLHNGTPRTVFAPDLNKYLVVWVREENAAGTTSKLYGRFIGAAGQILGTSFVITDGVGGATRLTDNTNVRYDPVARKFGVIWEQRSGGIDIYFRTVGETGQLGPVVRVAESGDFEGAPDVEINAGGREYCAVYQKESGGVSRIAMRRIDADTGALGAETLASGPAFGRAQIAYNSRDSRYLLTWAMEQVDKLQGRFFSDCNANSPDSPMTVFRDNFFDAEMAYNPRSNTFGFISALGDDVANGFLALDAGGNEIVFFRVFLDAINGNYVPTIAPNLVNGTFGGASSRDYGSYRFAPDLGGERLRVQ